MIRESTQQDKERIFSLHLAAFGDEEGEAVAALAINLLGDETARPLLSLVAEEEGEIIGHALFTSATISNSNVADGFILAPLAVANSHQGVGIGTRLIRQGLETLTEQGAAFVMVYGDPGYYSRTGFITDHHVQAPYRLKYPDAWMAQGLQAGILDSLKGTLKCAVSLSHPEYW